MYSHLRLSHLEKSLHIALYVSLLYVTLNQMTRFLLSELWAYFRQRIFTQCKLYPLDYSAMHKVNIFLGKKKKELEKAVENITQRSAINPLLPWDTSAKVAQATWPRVFLTSQANEPSVILHLRGEAAFSLSALLLTGLHIYRTCHWMTAFKGIFQ